MRGAGHRLVLSRGEAGQTTSEYLMIAGLLTAIIVQITQIVVPTLGDGVTRLLHHMVEYLTSPGT